MCSYKKNSIRQTDNPQSVCELFRSYSYDPKQNRGTAEFQTFDIGPHILSLKKKED